MAGRQKRKSRLEMFSHQDKVALILAVKKRPVIWDPAHPKHSDFNAVNKAWQVVSEVIEKEVVECRTGFKALRESYRYHGRSAGNKRLKAGTAGGDLLDSPDDRSIDWEFGDLMSFLPNVPSKPRTLQTDSSCPSEEMYLEHSSVDFDEFPSETMEMESTTQVEDIVEEEPTTCSYAYVDNPQKKRRNVSEKLEKSDGNDMLINTIAEMVKLQRSIIEAPTSSLQNPEMHAYWDSIIRELPASKLPEVRIGVSELLHDIYRESKSKINK